MKSLFLALIVFCTLATCMVWAVDGSRDRDQQKAVKQSRRIISDLYQVLRNIAFPKSPYSVSSTTHNRFILMSPGKVLNYFDYYPGNEYTESLKSKNMSAQHVLISPSVMEKWFDISDVVVGGNLDSGDTGKRLSRIYENVLSQITIRDFKTLYHDAEARYNEAKRYLTEPVQNPVNLTEITTRMGLYSIYQDEYAEAQLNMEEKINNARLTMSSIEYELWFQRNFRLLNDQVEDAYSKWLVFGKKELVELYKTFLDTTTAGAALEEARISLRASGTSSLDRTRTIYPVSFEPSNWYEYLLARDTPPTRDMLVTRQNMLQSQINTLRAAVRFTSESDKAEQTSNALERRVNYRSNKRDNATRDAINAEIECINRMSANESQTTEGEDPCDQFEQEADSAVDETFEQAGASSEYFSATLLLKSDEKFQRYMLSRIAALERQKTELDTQLDNLNDDQVYLGEIVESPEFKALNESRQGDLDAKWLKFYYNSDSTHINTQHETNSISVNLRISNELTSTANGQFGIDTEELKKAFNSAKLQTSGELLRVFIKRPWFKPSLFDNPALNFVQQDSETQKTAYVSPPPSTEAELADIINGKHKNVYMLPEYVTSFLLARNIKLQFSGLDSRSISKAMQMIVGGSLNTGLPLVFDLSAAVGIRRTKQSVTADRTANGMIIHIPGAQIIGYYTQVMPEFPKEQS